MNLDDYIKNLDPELQERARACGSTEELLALAKEAKVPVPDEVLEAIAGGDDSTSASCRELECPKCGSRDIEVLSHSDTDKCKCRQCGYEFYMFNPYL